MSLAPQTIVLVVVVGAVVKKENDLITVLNEKK